MTMLFPGHRAGASLKPEPRRGLHQDPTVSSPATEPGPH